MSKIIIKKFHAKWCGPCKAYEPILQKIEESYKDQIEVQRLDVDDDSTEELQLKYNVRSVPFTVIEFEDQIKLKRAGLLDFQTLKSEIDQLLK